MERDYIFELGNYKVFVDEPVEVQHGQFAHYALKNEETGVVEMRLMTFVQAVSSAIELTNQETKLDATLSEMVEKNQVEESNAKAVH